MYQLVKTNESGSLGGNSRCAKVVKSGNKNQLKREMMKIVKEAINNEDVEYINEIERVEVEIAFFDFENEIAIDYFVEGMTMYNRDIYTIIEAKEPSKAKKAERKTFYAEDVIASVKTLRDSVTDDCTWSGVIELACELLGVSQDTVEEMIAESDKDELRANLKERFKQACDNHVDELDFFMEILEDGLTLDDIKKYLPDSYDYAKFFMEEHGLI